MGADNTYGETNFNPQKAEQKRLLSEIMQEDEKLGLYDNLPMSAEVYYDNNNTVKTTTVELMEAYANYLLYHHINVLAERIANKTQRVDIQGHGVCDVIDKKEILKIAKDYINELNLQSSK